MWLEQTVAIWAPLAGAALLWILLRLRTLSREVRSLRENVAQLQQERGDTAPTPPHRQKRYVA
jgi:hypothetical protein